MKYALPLFLLLATACLSAVAQSREMIFSPAYRLTLHYYLTASVLQQFGVQPIIDDAPPTQPIPFSHKRHLEMHLACNFCHEKINPGVQMALPSATKCMSCHQGVATDKPAIQKLAQLVAANQPIDWVQVYSVPGFIFWSHQIHLDASLPCAACHGDVSQMDIMRKATNVTTMNGCVSCHKQKEAPTGCLTCHETQSSRFQVPDLEPLEVILRRHA